MKIKKALFSAGSSGYFFDDQRAIKKGAGHDGFIYKGKPCTPGFRSIRQAGESISVILVMENGGIACGDCAAVQYSGAGGRDPLFLAKDYLPFLNKTIKPALEGADLKSFRETAGMIDKMEVRGKRIHTALRYGITQALLDAKAVAQNKLKTEVICEEYKLPVIAKRVPVFAQSGDNRYENVDRMILKHVDVLPHGLINNIKEKLGTDGGKLKEYIKWLVARIKHVRSKTSYKPDIHIDVYGTIGIIFNFNIDKIAKYLASLEKAAGGFELYIEGPVDMEEKYLQMETLLKITNALRRNGSKVKIVADEWCNTLEDIRDFTDAKCCDMVQIKTPDLGGIQNIVESVLYCREKGMGAYQGGTCNETDVSARTCVHLAMAARPCRMLAKPGMGFDEGFTIVNNEMERIIEILKHRG